MTIYCQSCKGPMPVGAQACPNCGTRVPSPYATVEEEHSPTMISGNIKGGQNTSSSYATVAPGHHTDYGATSSINASNPYSLTPPPPHPPERQKKTWLLVGMGLLIIILLGVVGALVLPPLLQPATSSSGTSTQIVSTSEVAATPLTADDAQTLYDQTITTQPTIDDALSGPNNYGWDNKALENTSCQFRDSQYYSSAVPGYFSPCYASASNFADFIFQAEMTVTEGHSGGLIFRADKTSDQAYLFRISTDGTYILNKYTLENNQLQNDTLTSGDSSEIQPGANTTNTLAVIARGNMLYLFINGTYIANATDETYRSGAIGIYTDSDAGSVEAFFRNAKVWQLQ